LIWGAPQSKIFAWAKNPLPYVPASSNIRATAFSSPKSKEEGSCKFIRNFTKFRYFRYAANASSSPRIICVIKVQSQGCWITSFQNRAKKLWSGRFELLWFRRKSLPISAVITKWLVGRRPGFVIMFLH